MIPANVWSSDDYNFMMPDFVCTEVLNVAGSGKFNRLNEILTSSAHLNCPASLHLPESGAKKLQWCNPTGG